MLEAQGVSVAFSDHTVLDNATVTVGDGEIVALLGPSGSGKSTLLRVIAGLLVPDHGRVLLDGVDITALPTHRRNIGMVFQDDQLFPHRTVAQNIEFGPRMLGWDKARRSARVSELLDLVGLSAFAERRVTDLSGGEAKRVALVRTLASEPSVVLLDEPLTGLDRELHDQLADELARLLRRTNTRALLVTHDRDEATMIADRIVTIDAISGPGVPGHAQ